MFLWSRIGCWSAEVVKTVEALFNERQIVNDLWMQVSKHVSVVQDWTKWNLCLGILGRRNENWVLNCLAEKLTTVKTFPTGVSLFRQWIMRKCKYSTMFLWSWIGRRSAEEVKIVEAFPSRVSLFRRWITYECKFSNIFLCLKIGRNEIFEVACWVEEVTTVPWLD